MNMTLLEYNMRNQQPSIPQLAFDWVKLIFEGFLFIFSDEIQYVS